MEITYAEQARLVREQIAQMDDGYLLMFMRWARRAARVGNLTDGTDGPGYTQVMDLLYPGNQKDDDGIVDTIPAYEGEKQRP